MPFRPQREVENVTYVVRPSSIGIITGVCASNRCCAQLGHPNLDINNLTSVAAVSNCETRFRVRTRWCASICSFVVVHASSSGMCVWILPIKRICSVISPKDVRKESILGYEFVTPSACWWWRWASIGWKAGRATVAILSTMLGRLWCRLQFLVQMKGSACKKMMCYCGKRRCMRGRIGGAASAKVPAMNTVSGLTRGFVQSLRLNLPRGIDESYCISWLAYYSSEDNLRDPKVLSAGGRGRCSGGVHGVDIFGFWLDKN